jgi:glyoxylase-like metal-dependent hydrolase (beta-lactamase superfamily II)
MLRQPILVGVVEHPTAGRWLIDTGAHPRLLAQGWATRLFLRAARMEVPAGPPPVDKLAGIFLTHFHLDHVAGLLDFPGVPVRAARAGYHAALAHGMRQGYCRALIPYDFAGRALWLEDTGTDLFGDGSVIAMPLPGHAEGQHGLLCRTQSETVFFVADAVAHRDILLRGASQSLPSLIANNRTAERNTRRSLREHSGPIVPAHCPVSYLPWRR